MLYKLSTFIVFLIVTAITINPAYSFSSKAPLFNAQPIDDSDLDNLRGGFITVGGMQVDFGLTSTTVVNGDEYSSISVNSQSFQNLTQEEFFNVVQVGGNNYFKVENVTNPYALVTVIQNSLNDTDIKNFNLLDLTVTGIDVIRTQSTLSQINYNQSLQ